MAKHERPSINHLARFDFAPVALRSARTGNFNKLLGFSHPELHSAYVVDVNNGVVELYTSDLGDLRHVDANPRHCASDHGAGFEAQLYREVDFFLQDILDEVVWYGDKCRSSYSAQGAIELA